MLAFIIFSLFLICIIDFDTCVICLLAYMVLVLLFPECHFTIHMAIGKVIG